MVRYAWLTIKNWQPHPDSVPPVKEDFILSTQDQDAFCRHFGIDRAALDKNHGILRLTMPGQPAFYSVMVETSAAYSLLVRFPDNFEGPWEDAGTGPDDDQQPKGPSLS